MSMLLLNAGSSSLKATLVDPTDERVIANGQADWAGTGTRYRFLGADGRKHAEEVTWTGHAAAVHRFVADLQHTEPIALPHLSELSAVGHRIVHGGPFTTSIEITGQVRSQIESLTDLAPLHNPPSLETLAAAEEALSNVPHVAVFDTSFHATLSAEAYTYPVPERWTREWGIRRFGFHGLSHAYCARRADEMLGNSADDLRLVICHLGHGCSAAAVRGGHCIDTTMGFTPLDGLMMATRSGSIDPGIVLHIQQNHGLSVVQVETALNRESGLLGVSGVSADMRQVLAAAQNGNIRASLAIAIYTRRVRQAIGALAVTLGGIDALVFTAGIGENSAEIRRQICQGLECLGLYLNQSTNDRCEPDADIASDDSQARILVIATREDLTMLREVVRTLANKRLTQ
jgi:acetate kinase